MSIVASDQLGKSREIALASFCLEIWPFLLKYFLMVSSSFLFKLVINSLYKIGKYSQFLPILYTHMQQYHLILLIYVSYLRTRWKIEL